MFKWLCSSFLLPFQEGLGSVFFELQDQTPDPGHRSLTHDLEAEAEPHRAPGPKRVGPKPTGGCFLQHHEPPGFQGDPHWEGP